MLQSNAGTSASRASEGAITLAAEDEGVAIMRKSLSLAATVLACAFAAGAAHAQGGFGQVKIVEDPAPAAAATPAAAKPASGEDLSGVTVTGRRIPESQRDPTEVLCHDETPIGTRFPKRVCATRRQYSERRQMDQEQLFEWTLGKPYKSN
jgi:hypothetical protein